MTQVKTYKGSPIKRWAAIGVGKCIGSRVYIHKDSVQDTPFDGIVSDCIHLLPQDFEWNLLRISTIDSSVGFYNCVEFDTVNEPVAGECISVKINEGTFPTITRKTINQIFHHKWLWVFDDYTGFDVAESVARSESWLKYDDVPFAVIGHKDKWEEWLKTKGLEL